MYPFGALPEPHYATSSRPRSPALHRLPANGDGYLLRSGGELGCRGICKAPVSGPECSVHLQAALIAGVGDGRPVASRFTASQAVPHPRRRIRRASRRGWSRDCPSCFYRCCELPVGLFERPYAPAVREGGRLACAPYREPRRSQLHRLGVSDRVLVLKRRAHERPELRVQSGEAFHELVVPCFARLRWEGCRVPAAAWVEHLPEPKGHSRDLTCQWQQRSVIACIKPAGRSATPRRGVRLRSAGAEGRAQKRNHYDYEGGGGQQPSEQERDSYRRAIPEAASHALINAQEQPRDTRNRYAPRRTRAGGHRRASAASLLSSAIARPCPGQGRPMRPSRQAADHGDPEAPGPPHARQLIGAVLSILALLVLLGWAPPSNVTLGIAIFLAGLGLLLS